MLNADPWCFSKAANGNDLLKKELEVAAMCLSCNYKLFIDSKPLPTASMTDQNNSIQRTDEVLIGAFDPSNVGTLIVLVTSRKVVAGEGSKLTTGYYWIVLYTGICYR
ncbi:hypothetical protein Pint_19617 [Pistacia integerrima]|uniref:Uncharacterized protein n=1 Tax=Pistacia integerrima TaxID=434235 RepID=A0ACC0X934_9ROSI|nr:hypothetical protein Pint_19617 [Pistacia integerrima]